MKTTKTRAPFRVAQGDRFRDGAHGDIYCVLLVNRSTKRATVMTERAYDPADRGTLRVMTFAALARKRRLHPRILGFVGLPAVRVGGTMNSVRSAATVARRIGVRP